MTAECHVASKKKTGKGTFLQTFVCYLESTKGRHRVRGILDMASKESYILKDVAQNPRPEVKGQNLLSIGCFMGEDFISLRLDKILATLGNVEGTFQRTFTFCTTPCITSTHLNLEFLPDVNTSLKVLPPLLKYADPNLFDLQDEF